MAPFMFCPVCRLSHDKGRGHKYGVKHKQNLGEFLSKARLKSQDIRASLAEVALLQDDGRGRNNFWCAFCEQEVDEKESLFTRESAIQHLGGSLHFMNVKKFLSEQGADVADSRRYIIPKEELTKWQERCKVLMAKVERASGVESSGTNNIHSDTSRCDPGSSLALGNREIVSHVASVDDVRPLSVLTLGISQKSVPTYDGASSVATAIGDHQWFSMSAAAETSQLFSNGWGNVAGSGLHYMDPASRFAPSNFGIAQASTSKSSHQYYLESSNQTLNRSRGVDTINYTQAPGARLSATQRVSSAQCMLPSLPAAAPSQYTVMAIGQDLSKVVCPRLLPGEGNVHSGATPPWIGPGVDEKFFVAPSIEIGPTMELVKKKQSLSKNQERKLAKLRPPNRVGAAWAEMRRAQLEREARGETVEGVPQADATWLPNFGRVWQSGSRHDTRKEFEAEKRREAKRLGRPLGKRGAPTSESPVQFQPYVSKRKRAVTTDE